jgi:hypothetical protein
MMPRGGPTRFAARAEVLFTKCVEGASVLKNTSMPAWSPDQGLKDPLSAVFWPWFGGVVFVFDPPTGQIATFSTGWGLLRTSP